MKALFEGGPHKPSSFEPFLVEIVGFVYNSDERRTHAIFVRNGSLGEAPIWYFGKVQTEDRRENDTSRIDR